ncbi:MAG: DUF4783 domain-containing protein [Salibacteraceae bacterium]
MRGFVLMIVLSLFTLTNGWSQGINEKVSTALKTGNSKVLVSFFGPTVDMAILEVSNVYSKPQAEQVLKNFFAKHQPTDFSLVHKGASKLGMQYAIGNLTTSKGTFRISYYVRKGDNGEFIKEFRIDAN